MWILKYTGQFKKDLKRYQNLYSICQDFWEDTKSKILSNDYNHFIKSSEHPVCHVRPKALNSSDTMTTPQGNEELKRCYWFNRKFVFDYILSSEKNDILMKKAIITFLLSFTCIVSFSQDLIIKTDGSRLETNILEETNSTIRYKAYSDPEGLTFSVPISNVLTILYHDGKKKDFPQNASKSQNETTASTLDVAPVESYDTAANDVQDENLVNNHSPLPTSSSYKSLSQYYDHYYYYPSALDKYNPIGCGIASFFYPGVGQMLCGEWQRGFAFFLSSTSLLSTGLALMEAGDKLSSQHPYEPDKKTGLYYQGSILCLLTAIGLDVFCIVDAVRIAKVKNMYYRDLFLESLNMTLKPSVSFVPSGIDSYQPNVGLSLSLNF